MAMAASEVRSARRLRVKIVAPSMRIVGGQSIQADWLIAESARVPGLAVELVPINPQLAGPLGWLQRFKYARTVITELSYLLLLLAKLPRTDVVHVFSASYFSFLLAPTPAILLGKLLGKKVILHYHSGEAEDHLRRWGRTAIPTLRRADRIIVPSRFLVEVFGRFGLVAEAIPNFVRTGHIPHRERASLRPVFLANRNLEPIYGVDSLLLAFQHIQRDLPQAKLLLAGDGSQRRKLEALADELELRNVEFLGIVPPGRMGKLYQEADIYLNASRVDNMPLSILESFAAGLPVVTSAAGGIPWFVKHGETALMVPRDDPEALASSALLLLKEPERARRLARRARHVFERSYVWNAVRDRWLTLYRELVDRPLRLTIVAPSLDILGGQAVQAQRLHAQLSSVEGLEASLLFVNPRLRSPWRVFQRFKYLRTVVTELRYWLDLLRGLRHTDVVHVFSAAYLSFLLAPVPALLVARLYDKGAILNYRSGEAEDHLTRWRWTAARLMRLADRLVVGSDYLIGVFARFGLRAHAIPNIVDVSQYNFRVRRPLRPVFLSNRNLEPHYNVGCILRAFALIQERFADARLLVAGDGSERRDLEKLADDLELAGVEFLGFVEPDRMSSLYDRADIYLNASEIDNMPTSIIEAFAAGLPVVSTAAGGIPYFVEDGVNALLVAPGNHEALARQALRLLEEPHLAEELVRAAREECQVKYTWPSIRAQWVRLYREVAPLPADALAPAGAREPRGAVREGAA